MNSSMNCKLSNWHNFRDQVYLCNLNFTGALVRVEKPYEGAQAREQCLIQRDMQIYLDCEGSNPVTGGCVRRIHMLLRYPENFRVTRPSTKLDDDVQRFALVRRHRLTRWMNHGWSCNENKQEKRLTFVELCRTGMATPLVV